MKSLNKISLVNFFSTKNFLLFSLSSVSFFIFSEKYPKKTEISRHCVTKNLFALNLSFQNFSCLNNFKK